ncbi:hypothetical protein [Lysinibacillus piscis]|uniref:hypothetical protein n=1 Tax=Lysinibacillus piscis TaxID=2518931 RepID=UPI00222F779F|nr:hypothetical protein [Lysinibacillus sp. KH24]
MVNNYSIFKANVLAEVSQIILDEKILVTPEIELQNTLFKGNESLLERVHFKKKNPNTRLIHLFQELPINKKTGKIGESSRLSFLNMDKFPDGCFFLMDEVTKRINCYICELKHRPGDKILDGIDKQFYSGLLHCKTFFATVKLDEEYTITYHFLIVGCIRLYDEYEKQPIVNGVPKPAPGTPPRKVREIRAYQQYKAGTIYFSYVKDFTSKFDFPFTYVQLNPIGNVDERTLVLEAEFELNFI